MTQSDDAEEGGVEERVARPNGLSYIQIPAIDPVASARFYEAVFGWQVRQLDTHPSFSDGTGHVIGAWTTERPVAREAGVLPYIYVANIDDTLAKAQAQGAEVVREPYPEGGLWVATIRDPAGNVIGVWQSGPR
jgi:predicted enzyme related to lactoylglutathione lyase